ncbi:glycosyltransferase family 2 protein [Photobacterium leiognathi]|uniref:glycosyltransferase family 2 protein n=1 Tax=Photobacterium leiognathi TaxID=553611 RepID=UPI00020884D9|nr:glycosyltransferase family 2 protein [Photobacterium leiognathi]PSW53764.1 glycosyltransferase family 2 protein [Photobacterium leiognathi subsp. mandapamensis]GAA04679.1 glycosyl transferase 2 family protein [Photobacterium leiognathi subsp. mandapamensis svers.1.1.]
MLVSVIIPVYNRAKIIDRTLDSVAAQTYKNIEIIVVDDCSDDSEELLVKLGNYNLDIKYIRHKKNMHGGASRNTGIDASKGDYIAFLDSDDIWADDKIERCVNRGMSENEILYSKIEDRNIVKPTFAFDNTKRVDEYLIVDRQTMQTSSLFMHSSFARVVKFDPSLKRFQDTDFIIRAQKQFEAKFSLIDSVLVYMSDDDKGSRISSSVDPEPAQIWLRKIRPLMTEKSIAVFTFNRIINYSSNSLPRITLLRLFVDGRCYKYFFNLDFKVFVKCILGSYQSKLRR